MFDINHRKRGIVSLKDRYFAKKIEKDAKDVDVIYYFYCKEEDKNAQLFNTICIDLRQTDEEIYESFSKTNKWIIRKVKREEPFVFEYIDNPTDEDIDRYVACFNKFAKAKGIYMCDKQLLTSLRDASRLEIHRALFNRQELCAFAYIMDDDRATIQYEWNARFWIDKDTDMDTYRMVGHANKALEYFSMIYLRDKGIITYDFCGVTLDETNKDATNIDNRKKSFGGKIMQEYNFMYPLTFKGKIFCLLKKIIKK